MFKIKDFHRNIYVGGTMVVETGKKVSYVGVESFVGDNINQYELIDLDITTEDSSPVCNVNDDFEWDDDVIYHVNGDFSVVSEQDTYLKSPYNCIYEYNNNLLDLYEIFKLEVDFTQRRILNRMLYLSILSIYELFMADLSITCFMRFDKIRDSFRKDTKYNNKSDDDIIESLINKHYNRFRDNKNCNRWSVKNHFKKHYDLDIPPSSCLEEVFKTRNDIAHRYNLNKQHNEVVEIKDKDIEELASETNKFVYELFEKLIDKVYSK